MYLHIILILVSINYASTQNELVVTTNNGPVRGLQSQTIGEKKTFYSFKKIPFAKPPIGQLRFEPPVPIDNWSDVLNATEDGDGCIQTNGEDILGSENCLFLNVYTPQLQNNATSVSLPVMVWIYGGGFKSGWSKYEFCGPDYLLEKGVVFVSINYRLGIFGFLSTGDTVLPGNAGLKDQSLAIKWIKNNIQHFGGNPNKITIFGQSAGSASVSYHLQSPLSKGLFSQAIMESGTTLCTWGRSKKSKEAGEETAKELRISFKNSGELIEGLKTIDAIKLEGATGKVSTRMALTGNILDGIYPFAPVIEPQHEGAFFSSKSHELLSSGNFYKVPTIIGFNSMESLLEEFSALLRAYFAKFGFDPSLLLPSMNIKKISDRLLAGSSVKKYYFGLKPISLSSTETLNKFISESTFNRPITETAHLISQHAPVYLYLFDFLGNIKNGRNRTGNGASHSEELAYIFNINPSVTLDKLSANPTETELLLRNRMTTLWTNFAKNGNPTPNNVSLFDNYIWEKTNPDTLNYLHITNDLSTKLMKDEKFWKFWSELFEKYGTPPYSTY